MTRGYSRTSYDKEEAKAKRLQVDPAYSEKFRINAQGIDVHVCKNGYGNFEIRFSENPGRAWTSEIRAKFGVRFKYGAWFCKWSDVVWNGAIAYFSDRCGEQKMDPMIVEEPPEPEPTFADVQSVNEIRIKGVDSYLDASPWAFSRWSDADSFLMKKGPHWKVRVFFFTRSKSPGPLLGQIAGFPAPGAGWPGMPLLH